MDFGLIEHIAHSAGILNFSLESRMINFSEAGSIENTGEKFLTITKGGLAVLTKIHVRDVRGTDLSLNITLAQDSDNYCLFTKHDFERVGNDTGIYRGWKTFKGKVTLKADLSNLEGAFHFLIINPGGKGND